MLQSSVLQQSEQVNQADYTLGPRTAPLCVIDWIEKYAQVRSIRDQFDFSSVANVRCSSAFVAWGCRTWPMTLLLCRCAWSRRYRANNNYRLCLRRNWRFSSSDLDMIDPCNECIRAIPAYGRPRPFRQHRRWRMATTGWGNFYARIRFCKYARISSCSFNGIDNAVGLRIR